jgi:hypothetical protein
LGGAGIWVASNLTGPKVSYLGLLVSHLLLKLLKALVPLTGELLSHI